ncbi:hypothetical protein [Dactylosporangium sp. CA-092794]|uniref:hypothetical protein n=1 Tax=Dactylosporangium sp. CA-092794 TaxID=3239929 RepID=UPI003D8CC057
MKRMTMPAVRRLTIVLAVLGPLAALGAAACEAGAPRPAPARPLPGPARSGTGSLRDALIGPADVPAGFTRTTQPPTEPHRGDPADCARRLDELETLPAAGAGVTEARVVYATPGPFAMLQEVLRDYADGRAAGVVTAAGAALARCPRFTLSYADGTVITVSVAVRSASPERVTAAVTAQATGFSVAENLAVCRVGRVVVILSHTGPEPPDLAETERLLGVAVDRLRQQGFTGS